MFVEILERQARAGEQPGERFFRCELTDRALRAQYVHFLGHIHQLKAVFLGQALQRQAQALRRNLGLFPDRGGLRFRRARQSNHRQANSRYAYSHVFPRR